MIGNLNIWAMISLEITEKNNVFNKYVTNTRDSITFSQFSNWSEELVKVLEKSRNKYFMNLSNKSTDPRTQIKSYLSIMQCFYLTRKLVFENRLNQGRFHNPIHKSHGKFVVKNFRLASLLTICGKVFERINIYLCTRILWNIICHLHICYPEF